jgi:hypothetical protein
VAIEGTQTFFAFSMPGAMVPAWMALPGPSCTPKPTTGQP